MQSNLCQTQVADVGIIIELPEVTGKKVSEKCQTASDKNIKIQCDSKIKCEICKCELPSTDHILEHIGGIRHNNNFYQLRLVESSENTGKKVCEKCQTASDKNIKILNDGTIKCEICKCELPSTDHILEHIGGIRHNNNFNQLRLVEPPENTGKTVLEKCQTVSDRNIKILNDGKTECEIRTCELPSAVNISAHTGEIQLANKFNTLSLIEPPETTGKKVLQTYQTVLDRNIKILNDGKIECEICECELPSIGHILAHIGGKQHEKNFNQLCLIKPPENTGKKVLEKCQTVLERNIKIMNDGTIECEICECELPSIGQISSHIRGTQHKNNLKQQVNNLKLMENTTYSQKDKQILLKHATVLESGGIHCKVCDRWIDSMFNYSQHVTEKGHLAELENYQTGDSTYSIHANNVGVDEVTLLKHATVLESGGIHCKVCDRKIDSMFNYSQHVKGKSHLAELENYQAGDSEYSIHANNVGVDEVTLLKHATVLESGGIHCKVCDRKIDSMFNYSQHVKGKGHLAKLKNYQAEDSEYSIHTNNVGFDELTLLKHATVLESGGIHCKVCDRKIDSMFNYSQHVKGKGHLAKLENYQAGDSAYSIHANNVGVDEVTLLKHATVLKSGGIHCKVCDRKIDSMFNYSQHVKGKDHLAKLENYQSGDSEYSIHANGVIHCKVCDRKIDSMFNYSQHVKGKGHSAKLKNYQTRDSEYSIHANSVGVDVLPENLIEELKHRTKHDHKEVQTNMFDCELYNKRMSMNDLSTYINSHWDDQSLNSAKVLYKCVCCKSIINGDTSFIYHIRKNTHVHNFRNFFEHYERGIIETHATNKSQNASEKNNSIVFTILSPKVENTSVHFEEKCFINFDNVHYSCEICKEELSDTQSIILHCVTKMHCMNIEQLFSGGEVKNDNDTVVWSLLNYFYELYINNSNSKIQTLDASFTDLAMSNAVYNQIMQKIKQSPLISRSKTKTNTVVKRVTEKRVTFRLNKSYCKEYFQLENEMYTLTNEKIDDIKRYFKFFIRRDKDIYCMVCKRTFSENLDLLYEHTRLQSHRQSVMTKILENAYIEQYINVVYIPKVEKGSKQESTQNSKQESTQESSEEVLKIVVTCEVCKVHLKDVDTIKHHIECLVHKQNHDKNYNYVNITVDSVLKNFSDLYYSIQRYVCVNCKIKFPYKVEFLKHISCVHSKNLKKGKKNYMFDFCIPCATLWISERDSFDGHCQDILHKYLLKSNDFMVEDVPKCIINMLKQVDRTIHLLLKEVIRVTEDHVKEEVRKSLEIKAQLCYSRAKAFLFGSRDIGLGFTNCDIDIYIDTGNKYYTNNDAEKEELLRIQEAISIDEDIWGIEELLLDCQVPIIKLIYKPKNLDCDISFQNGLSVEKSKLIKSFNNACLFCKKLTVFIKKWLSFINLRGGHGFSNFALYWIVIYYLQEKKHLPSIAELIKEHDSSEFIGDWQIGFASVKCKNSHEDSATELLHGFFEFYGNFDYQRFIICPLMGSLIAKSEFAELKQLPEAMKTYIKHLQTAANRQYLRIDSPLCVQDPLILSQNITKGVSSISLKYFRQYCIQCAAILKLRMK